MREGHPLARLTARVVDTPLANDRQAVCSNGPHLPGIPNAAVVADESRQLRQPCCLAALATADSHAGVSRTASARYRGQGLGRSARAKPVDAPADEGFSKTQLHLQQSCHRYSIRCSRMQGS